MNESWSPLQISVAFMTCPREPHYLGQTLASFFSADSRAGEFAEIVVAVDAPDLECASDLLHHEGVRFVPRTEEESARIAEFKLHRKACHNYWRTMGMASPGVRAVLVCEDDVVFRDGWVGMLMECLNEMREAGLHEFILAVYSPHDHEAGSLRRGQYYSSYMANGFYGTQSVLYMAGEVEPVREIVWQHGVLSPDGPYDLLMKRRAIERQHLYAIRCSLAQHIGATTTGLGGFHQSPSFGREWPSPLTPPSPPIEEIAIVHPRWKDRVALYADGTFARRTGSNFGRGRHFRF